MIKSSKVTLKHLNTCKKDTLSVFLKEYRRVVSCFIDILWDMGKITPLLDKDITSKVDTWLSARMIQCAGKQASGIVRGTQVKQKRRLYIIEKLKDEGKFKKARKLYKIYDEISITKPNINNVEPELDSRFVKIDLDNETSFDGWITLSSIGAKIKIVIPFKKHKHFNKLHSKGELNKGVRISLNTVTFTFKLPDVELKDNTTKNILGIDIGQTTVLSCSNGTTSFKNKHGHDLSYISAILCRKKKGSKGFERADKHRKNYINWTINNLDLTEFSQVNIENIKNMRKGVRSSRRLSHWTYTDIFSKIESVCYEQGVLVKRINPTYTSKRCNKCGYTRTNNRKGKLFKCGNCNYTADADLNASMNIACELKPIWFKQRHKYDIKKGFFWKSD